MNGAEACCEMDVEPDLPTIQAAIREVAWSLNLSSWTLEGVHAWPVMRAVVYGVLSRAQSLRLSRFAARESTTAVAIESTVGLDQPPEVTILHGAILFNVAAHSQPAEVVFHQLPQDYAGAAKDQLADPLIDIFRDYVHIQKLCRFEPGLAVPIPSRRPLQYRLIGEGTVSRAPPTDVHRFLTTAERFLAWLEARGFTTGESPFGLLQRMSVILDRAKGAEAILRRLAPRLLLVHRYHDEHQIPFVIAARRLGIVSVDIQHGYADACTPSNDFHEAPPEGYVGLPDVFWTWGAGTARRLEAGFPPRRLRPQILVGGAPWECAGRPSPPGEVTPFPVKKSPERTILVAHQPDMIMMAEKGELLPAPLLQAIRQGPHHLRWLIRLHPTVRHLACWVVTNLGQHGLEDRTEVTIATTTPWPVLVKQIEVVVTGYSALALDARQQGLPVILLGQTGARVLAPLLEEAGLRTSETPEELLREVGAALKTPATSWFYADPAPVQRAREAFDKLLSY